MSTEFVDIVNRFGLQLLSLTLNEGSPNGICPLSIYSCLMMLAAGSRDNVLTEFGHVLGIDEKRLASAVADTVQLTSYLLRSDVQELSSASSVWCRKDITLRPQWKDTVENEFNATLGPLRAAPINDFVRHQTRGLVSQVVHQSDLVDVSMMLITCLFFNAKWATPFEIHLTQQRSTFYPFGSKPQPCAMMRRVASLNYREDSTCQICVLPYQQLPSKRSTSDPGPNWKAAIILPRQRGFSALRQIVASILPSPEGIRTLVAKCPQHSQKVDLSLPRFKTAVHHDLSQPLKALGLTSAFHESRDFGPMTSEEFMWISSASHDLVVEVDEEGTKMAAVTSIGMKSRSIQRHTEMRVDRPFVFLVFDEATKLILFSVTVTSVGQS